jgi:hypothetical protein
MNSWSINVRWGYLAVFEFEIKSTEISREEMVEEKLHLHSADVIRLYAGFQEKELVYVGYLKITSGRDNSRYNFLWAMVDHGQACASLFRSHLIGEVLHRL